jgi:hypothetical protein
MLVTETLSPTQKVIILRRFCITFYCSSQALLNVYETDYVSVCLCICVVFSWIEQYAPGFKSSIVGKDILTPPDLERIFGLTGGVCVCENVCVCSVCDGSHPQCTCISIFQVDFLIASSRVDSIPLGSSMYLYKVLICTPPNTKPQALNQEVIYIGVSLFYLLSFCQRVCVCVLTNGIERFMVTPTVTMILSVRIKAHIWYSK